MIRSWNMRKIDLVVDVGPSDLIASSHEELLVDCDGGMTHVRLAGLPAEKTRLSFRPQRAARTDSGAWLVSFYDSDAVARGSSPIAWLAAGATTPVDESLAPLAIEELHSFGDAVIAVPVLGDDAVRPWLCENGTWRELTELPSRARTQDEAERATARTVRLGDGSWVLCWNGAVYERRDGEMTRTFEARFDVPWFHTWQLVASGADGFFHLADADGLSEVRRDAPPVRHLEACGVAEITGGPDGCIIVQIYPDLVVYDPRARTVATIPADAVQHKKMSFFRWTPPGLVIGRSRGLALLPAEDLRELPREPVDDFVRRRDTPPDPPPALDGPLPFSRSRVVAHGDRIAIVAGKDLRAHTVDAPQWRRSFDATLVSLAVSGDTYGVLDANGVLFAVRTSDGEPIWHRSVAPNPRAVLAAPDGWFVVLASGGVFFVSADDEIVRVPFESPIAAAFDDEGRLLVSGEHARMSLVVRQGRELRMFPSPLFWDARALAFVDGTWMAYGELALHRWIEGEWTPIESANRTGHFVVARPDGKAFAVANGRGDVEVIGERAVRVQYGDSYAAPPDEELSITGLAFLDDGRLVVALDHGRANIVSPENALKLDEHRGDPFARWIFFHPKGILVAG